MVHKRIIQLLEVLAQRSDVDLAELFGYFAFVSSFIVHLFEPFVDPFPIRFDIMADMASVFMGFLQQNYPPLTGLAFRLGGGTDMIYEGDTEGLWRLLETGLKWESSWRSFATHFSDAIDRQDCSFARSDTVGREIREDPPWSRHGPQAFPGFCS